MEEGESQIIWIFILLIVINSIIVNRGVQCVIRQGLAECKWGRVSVIDVYCQILW